MRVSDLNVNDIGFSDSEDECNVDNDDTNQLLINAVGNSNITEKKSKQATSTFKLKEFSSLQKQTFCHICNWVTTVSQMQLHIQTHKFHESPLRSCIFSRSGLEINFDHIFKEKINVFKLLECERISKIRLQYLLA